MYIYFGGFILRKIYCAMKKKPFLQKSVHPTSYFYRWSNSFGVLHWSTDAVSTYAS